MEPDLKVPQSPLSTHRSESDDSSILGRSPPRQSQPRFTRSGSKSRSKSKEHPRQEVPSRFVKQNQRIPSSPPPFNDPIHSRFLRMPSTDQKREATPVKSLRRKPQSSGISEGTQRQLQWVKLERRCQLSEAENLKLLRLNKSLQSQLTELQGRIAALEEDCSRYKEKNLPQEHELRKQRNNGLFKLRQEISKQKAIDSAPSTEHLKHQLQTTQKDLQILKEALQNCESLRKAAEEAASIQRSERQRFLEALIQQLREEASQRDGLLERMKTQVNVLRVRLAKQEDEADTALNEELQTVKRKYGNVLKKYHEASQQLAAYIRREERGGRWMEHRQREDSLSFSP